MSVSPSAGQRLVQFGVLLAVLAAWYAITLPGHVSPLLLPAPAPVLYDFGVLLTTRDLWPDLLTTAYEWVAAFALAAVAGCSIGYLVSRTRYTVEVFDPLLAGLYSIPGILLYPLFLLFFGLGPASKIAIGATITFFPIVLNTIAGLSNVDRSYVTAARSMGANALQLFGSVLLPAALPVMLTGFRLGGIIGFMTILGCEMIASLAGLGHRIVALADDLESTQMFANILFAVLIGILINAGVSFAGSRGRGVAR